MACYHPIKAWRSKDGRSDTGAWPLVFNRKFGYEDQEVQVPCGQCVGCRLERSRQWAIRCVHESNNPAHVNGNIFITLTYNEENLPENRSLKLDDLQRFWKRLRKYIGSSSDNKLRYFACGEYGEITKRPHYHAVLFNYTPDDLIEYKRTIDGQLFISPKLSEIWGLGYVVIGSVTFESCAYVARYIMKKQLGKTAPKKVGDHWFDPETGERVPDPEFVCMSRKPGIGSWWIHQYKTDVITHDGVLLNGFMSKPPRYYMNEIRKEDEDAILTILAKRAKLAKDSIRDPDREGVKELCKLNKMKLLPRGAV